MLILPYKGKRPSIGARVYVAPNATLIGDIEIGDDASIWFGTVLRADVQRIRVGARTNIQDNCTVHVTNEDWPTIIEEDVSIGHNVIAHGCTIRRGALIGMGSILLDGSDVGEESLIGAGSLVPEGIRIPPRVMAFGSPVKVRRELTIEELERIRTSAPHYMEYKDVYLSEQRAESAGRQGR